MYQKIISQIDPSVNARLVEGYIRLGHSTLDHLSKNDFATEINLYKEETKYATKTDWDMLEDNAKSFGL